jgi:hypothetical protein
MGYTMAKRQLEKEKLIAGVAPLPNHVVMENSIDCFPFQKKIHYLFGYFNSNLFLYL